MRQQNLKWVRTCLVILAAWWLAGCTTVGVSAKNGKVVEPSDCEPAVFMSPEAGQTYDVLCEIDSNVGNLPWSPGTRSEALEEARGYVCGCGANAMVIDGFTTFIVQVKLKIRAVKVADPSKGEDLETARAILSCRDAGGQWANDSCKVEGQFHDTPMAKRLKQQELEPVETEKR